MTERAASGSTHVEQPRKRLQFGLAEQVLVGLVLGIAVGVFFGGMVGWLEIVGEVFVKLLQITVIPYISLSLITGLGRLSLDDVKSLALSGGSVLLLVWAITLSIVLLSPLSFPDWPSASFFTTSLVEEPAAPDFLGLFIPSNPFYAYANALVPAIVMFSLLIGLALIGLPNKGVLIDPLLVTLDTLVWVSGQVAKLAPIGVFALIASAVGTTDLADLTRLQVFVALFALQSLVLALWVLPTLVTVLTPLRYRDVVRRLRTPLITAFATGSALVVLPLLTERCQQLIAEAEVFDAEKEEEAESSVGILIPTVFTFPSAGALGVLSFILFGGWYVGFDVPLSDYPVLVFAGVPSLFGGQYLAIPLLLDLLRLPQDLFHVFVSVDVIGARFVALLAAMHFAAIALIATFALMGNLRLRLAALARFALVSVALIAAVFVAVFLFYTNVVIAPYSKDETLKGLTLLVEPQSAQVFRELPVGTEGQDGEPATLDMIRERGVLRACYQPGEYPSAFYNTASPPKLVGFDIELAHRFAQRLQLSLEFLPTESEEEAANLLGAGICDVYTRSLAISANRSEVFGMTDPIYRSSLGLIVRDHRRAEFATWSDLRAQGVSLRIGVDGASDSIARTRLLLPQAELLPYYTLSEQRKLLQSGGTDFDGMFDLAEEAAAWTLLYPRYSLIVPKPPIFIPVAYAVAADNTTLLEAFNAWLTAEKASGTVEALYRYWMLGEATIIARPPRWSVIRDVLGWVD